MINVAPAEKKQVISPENYIIRDLDGCGFPLWIDRNLEGLWGKATIDVAGWAAFRRLVLLEL